MIDGTLYEVYVKVFSNHIVESGRGIVMLCSLKKRKKKEEETEVSSLRTAYFKIEANSSAASAMEFNSIYSIWNSSPLSPLMRRSFTMSLQSWSPDTSR